MQVLTDMNFSYCAFSGLSIFIFFNIYDQKSALYLLNGSSKNIYI